MDALLDGARGGGGFVFVVGGGCFWGKGVRCVVMLGGGGGGGVEWIGMGRRGLHQFSDIFLTSTLILEARTISRRSWKGSE